MSPKSVIALLLLLLTVGCGGRHPVYTFQYATTPDFRWDRITSFDRTGGNADMVRLPPGEALDLPVIEGPAEISRLWFTFTKDAKALDGLALEITWDDAPGPSVRVPLEMFFGMSEGSDVEVENDFIHVTKTNSRNSFFPMPFRKAARIRIVNETDSIVAAFYYQIEFKRFDSPKALDDRLYFHALYRQAVPATQGERYLLLDTEGPGVFLGSNLTVTLNSTGWWGEGDEFFTIDGVTTQGTGTEDYYGGAWGWSFQPARGNRFGVTRAEKPQVPGGVWSVYRFHSEAPIRFDKHFRFDLEHGNHGFDGREPLANNYYSVAYYYLAKPQVQPPLPTMEERALRIVPLPKHKPGEWFEMETLVADGKMIPLVAGASATVRAPGQELITGLSGRAEALLTAPTSDARFVFPIDMPTTGTMLTAWKPTLIHTREPQGLNFDLYLNGQPLKRGISAYAPKRAPEKLELPTILLPSGVAMFEVAVTGMAPDAVDPGFFIGLDAIRFQEVPAQEGIADFSPLGPPETAPPAYHELAKVEGVPLDVGTGATPLALESGVSPLTAMKLGLYFPGKTARVVMEPTTAEPLGGQFQIDMVAVPATEPKVRHRALFSKNLVAGAYLRDGAVILWLRDSEFRYLYTQTESGLVPDGQRTRLRITMAGRVARIYINGALVRELEMREFGELNSYPGRWIIGNTEQLSAPFTGIIDEFSIRPGVPEGPSWSK
ncbi:DUF2961 domain-containing protein [bacterium]|nr:DUF2961 domain-containing protein [bacterium]